MLEIPPELPAAYELIRYDEIDDLREKASELAQNSANEGTLVWAISQTSARGRLNQQWLSHPGDLHCTIILRPDFPAELYPQIMLVAAVSMNNALATHLSAMTPLGFAWPNDITIAKHKVAAVWLDAGLTDTNTDNADVAKTDSMKNDAWLNVSTSVNIEHSPEDCSFPAISVREAEGTTELDSRLLIESYSRQFITQINIWSERGMDLIGKQWKSRAEGLGEEITIKLENEKFTGMLEEIKDNGEIIVRLADNDTRFVTLADYVEYKKFIPPTI